MTDQEIAERLLERATCKKEHTDMMVPTNGFGWTGVRCPRCGFSFFRAWEPGFGPK